MSDVRQSNLAVASPLGAGANGVERFGFDGGSLSTEDNIAAWREALSAFFDVADLEHGPSAPFRASLDTFAFGPVLFGLACAGGQRFSRTAETIARSGADHVIVQLYRRGGFDGVAAGAPVSVRAGDVCVFDLAQPIETKATAFENLTLVVPRPLLARSLTQLEALHGLVLKSDGVLTRLLANHFVALLEQAPHVDDGNRQAVVEGTIALVAACLRDETQERGFTQGASASPSFNRIAQHIEANLADPALTAEAIAKRFGLSRASLYRMFAPQGGVANHIRRRRLHQALFDLARPAGPLDRVGAVARRWNLGGVSAFTRAFKAVYGVTPSEVRQTAALHAMETTGDGGSALTRWMRAIAVRQG